MYETGGLRRLYLRARDNILKRVLVHAGGFNLALVMRKMFGGGMPRQLQGTVWALLSALIGLIAAVWSTICAICGSDRGKCQCRLCSLVGLAT